MGRKEIFTIVLLFFIGVKCQENARKNIPPSLIECYDNELYAKHNLLPHTMDTFISIIRKIEQSPMLNMDLRMLSAALLHRFRQDGIEKNPEVKPQAGIMPYAPLGQQFYRHAQTLRVIPGNAVIFPNDSISALERCTLHSMLSSSVDKYKHNGENRGCKTGNYGFNNYGFRRWKRNVQGPKDDVETISPEQLEMLMSKDQVDPNSKYPAFPPNHPSASARITEDQYSDCPIENGVLKTPWGTVSAGSLLAGIAAGLEPQMIRISELMKQQVEPRVFRGLPTDANMDNKFLATLAGDLAEVALDQGPQSRGRFSVGADGNWNSTIQPLYYFLATKEDLQMTAAEIRGDIDGLILANEVPIYYNKFSGLRLSQVLDMYYSNRGLFDTNIRACNRRMQLLKVAPSELLVSQTRSAAIVLNSVGYPSATISPEKIDTFSAQAVKDFNDFIPSMNKDNTCEFRVDAVTTRRNFRTNSEGTTAVDITFVVDTTWPFESIQSIIAQMLDNLDINIYNSNFTIMNGGDGNFIVNSSNSIIDFIQFNRTNYDKVFKGLNLALSMKKLQEHEKNKLDEEKRRHLAGGQSNVVVFIPYQAHISATDREYVWKIIDDMRKEVPDTKILFLTHAQKDTWTDLVDNFDDVVSINFSEKMENNPAIDTILAKIKQVQRRLVNTQCGSNYNQNGNSHPLRNNVEPNGINFYRIHPNYFMSDSDDQPKLKIQGSGVESLKLCWSREPLHINATAIQMGAECATVTANTHTIKLDCKDASYIHMCKPYYLSIAPTNSSALRFSCIDSPTQLCRYPYNIGYTISFENLVCKSSATRLLVTPLLLLGTLVRLFI